MKHVNQVAAGVILLSQALFGAAFAGSVTLSGDTVDFTFDDAMLGLLGPASLSGDTLYFTPVDFQSESLNGGGYTLASSTINIEVAAHEGWMFSNIALNEKGDYMLLGGGSTADVAGQIRVLDVAAPLTDVTAAIQPTAPLDNMGVPTTNWEAGAVADLSGWSDAQTLNVTVQNLLLTSTTAASSVAFLDKKFFGLTPTMAAITPIPEAHSYAMMLAGLGLVGWRIRRHCSSRVLPTEKEAL